jgi:hypothetical protein
MGDLSARAGKGTNAVVFCPFLFSLSLAQFVRRHDAVRSPQACRRFASPGVFHARVADRVRRGAWRPWLNCWSTKDCPVLLGDQRSLRSLERPPPSLRRHVTALVARSYQNPVLNTENDRMGRSSPMARTPSGIS